jgi:hypothetical protein
MNAEKALPKPHLEQVEVFVKDAFSGRVIVDVKAQISQHVRTNRVVLSQHFNAVQGGDAR